MLIDACKGESENIAKKLRLNLKSFDVCLKDEATRKAIEADIEKGIAIGLQGTPTILVNGRVFYLWHSKKAWRLLIENLSKN